jgi:hypothetical protein
VAAGWNLRDGPAHIFGVAPQVVSLEQRPYQCYQRPERGEFPGCHTRVSSSIPPKLSPMLARMFSRDPNK